MNDFTIIKMLTLGNSGIGKTKIIKNLCNTYEYYDGSTIALDFDYKILAYNNINYKLQFWDCSGDDRFKSIIRPYFINIKYLLIFFDINTQFKSNITNWLKEFNYDKNKHLLLLIGIYENKDNKLIKDVDIYLQINNFRYFYINKNKYKKGDILRKIIDMYNSYNKQHLLYNKYIELEFNNYYELNNNKNTCNIT